MVRRPGRRAALAALMLAAALAAVAAALDGSARVAVSARGPADPARDASLLVLLRNEGPVPLTGVRLRCTGLRVQRADGSSDGGVVRVARDGEIAPSPRLVAAPAAGGEATLARLPRGATRALACPAAPGDGPAWTGAELDLELRWSVLHLPREHRRRVRLAGSVGPDGVAWQEPGR